MNENQILYVYIGSNLVALVMVALSWFWKTGGRLLLVLLFLWAGLYDFRTAFVRPQEYVSFVRISYFSFLLRFFLQHTTGIIVAIAIGQLAIGVLVSLRGWVVKLGLWGAVLFLLAIAPLATVVGFWARLIMACAALLLLRATYSSPLWSELGALFRHHPKASGAF
jgi:hypothetical protein